MKSFHFFFFSPSIKAQYCSFVYQATAGGGLKTHGVPHSFNPSTRAASCIMHILAPGISMPTHRYCTTRAEHVALRCVGMPLCTLPEGVCVR